MLVSDEWREFTQRRAAKLAGTPDEHVGSITVTISKNSESSANNLVIYPDRTTGVDPIALSSDDSYTLHFNSSYPLTTRLSIIVKGSEPVVLDYDSTAECTYTNKITVKEEVELIFIVDKKTSGGILFVVIPVSI